MKKTRNLSKSIKSGFYRSLRIIKKWYKFENKSQIYSPQFCEELKGLVSKIEKIEDKIKGFLRHDNELEEFGYLISEHEESIQRLREHLNKEEQNTTSIQDEKALLSTGEKLLIEEKKLLEEEKGLNYQLNYQLHNYIDRQFCTLQLSILEL